MFSDHTLNSHCLSAKGWQQLFNVARSGLPPNSLFYFSSSTICVTNPCIDFPLFETTGVVSVFLSESSSSHWIYLDSIWISTLLCGFKSQCTHVNSISIEQGSNSVPAIALDTTSGSFPDTLRITAVTQKALVTKSLWGFQFRSPRSAS